MNRRSFFGFAIGLISAAPVALLARNKSHSVYPNAVSAPLPKNEIRAWGKMAEECELSGERHEQMMTAIREETAKAIREAGARGQNFGYLRRYEARRG